MNNYHDVIIVGFGPCGMKLSEILKENNIDFIVMENYMPGGKINVAPEIVNYPKHPPISGPDFAMEKFNLMNEKGIYPKYEEVIKLEKKDDLFIVNTNQNIYSSKYVVIASGTKEDKLGLQDEDKFFGHGLSYCALCDGHFYKNKDVSIVLGGDGALKEAMYLSRIVRNLYIISSTNDFGYENHLFDKIKQLDNVHLYIPYRVNKLIGEDKLSGIEIISNESQIIKIPCEGIFPIIGQKANTDFINFDVNKDNNGHLITDKYLNTSVDHLYAGGDVVSRDIRQIFLAELDAKKIAHSLLEKLK